MKPTEFLREFDRKDSGEYNDEAGMALGNLETICRSARELEKHIDTEENLPEWCQEKLAVVKGMLVAVTDYMVSQDTLDAKQDDFAFNTVRIAEQLNSMLEGGAYDLPGIDYDRPGDIKIKQRPHMPPQRPRHPDDPDFMDPDQRRLRADQARVKKAQDKYHAKKGVAEEETPFGSVSVANTPSNQKPYVEPSRQDIWDKNDLVNRQAEVREQKQLTLRYARKHGRKAMEDIWAKKTDVRMTVEEILEFLDATLTDPGISPEEFMGTRGLDEAIPLDKLRATAGSAQPKTDEKLRQFYADMKAKKQNMAKYANDTANMAKAAIANKMPLSKNQVNEFAGGMGASSVAIAPGVGKGAKVGSLFGGSYAPKSPFNKKRKQ